MDAWHTHTHTHTHLPPPPPAHTHNTRARAPPDAYRRAVQLSPADFRAWYGLGQTYELLAMPHYALHYYRCAHASRCAALRCVARVVAAAVGCVVQAVSGGSARGQGGVQPALAAAPSAPAASTPTTMCVCVCARVCACACVQQARRAAAAHGPAHVDGAGAVLHGRRHRGAA
jgi:hypothetical protein